MIVDCVYIGTGLNTVMPYIFLKKLDLHTLKAYTATLVPKKAQIVLLSVERS
jgi:hypothetical protein